MKKAYKILAVLLALCMFIMCFGCAKNEPWEPGAEKAPNESSTSDKKSDVVYKDGIIGENKNASGSKKKGRLALDSFKMAEAVNEADVADASPGSGGDSVPEYKRQTDAVAGTLTAGEIKDSLNLAHWRELNRDENWKKFAEERSFSANNSFFVEVLNGETPVFNAKVELLDKDSKVVYTAKTNSSGQACLLANLDNKEVNKDDYKFRIGSQVFDVTDKNKTVASVDREAAGVKALDLMFMIDTTGSMGDELEYIEEELADVVKRVNDSNEALSIRTSVNFYRDDGDEYVVKYFDFRSDVKECVEQIRKQSAGGGGDFPEAVHEALDNAVSGHEWREDAVKLCFLVLDAPPHLESEVQGVNNKIETAVRAAAEKGIRIIPVASSGVDQVTEYLLRSYAVATTGSYVFLTDDSGVGFKHLKPTKTDYEVEFLNECLIRIICENCGIKYEEPEPETTSDTEASTEATTKYEQ